MKIFEYFARIRIINLPHRTDRRREMDRELAKVGLSDDPRVSYFEAIRPLDPGSFTSIGARGVYESQRMLLKEAAMADESILILEDDCFFVPGAEDYDPPMNWDLIYGGYTAHQPDQLHLSDIEGAHMMGFSAIGAQRVSEFLENLEFEGIHPPIDAAYVWFRRRHPEIPTHFISPPIAGQRASRSDIARLKWFDRTPVARNIANFMRKYRPYQ